MIEKKFRVVRAFSWPDDGHRVNLYVNAYMNVGVRKDKFEDYIAAGLEVLAKELRSEAAQIRGEMLQEGARFIELTEFSLEEKKEIKQEEKFADRIERS